MAHRVDTEALGEFATRLQALSDHVSQQLATLDERMNGLQFSWNGVAAGEEGAARLQWRTGAEEMLAALSYLTRAATTALDNYQAAIAANAHMWGLG